nr:hypothetical protein [Streptomyces sp. SID10853]
MAPQVTVYPPDPCGGRRVRVGAEDLGVAHNRKDVSEFLRRAGLEDVDEDLVATSPLIRWHGGGPDAWPAPQ